MKRTNYVPSTYKKKVESFVDLSYLQVKSMFIFGFCVTKHCHLQS